MLEMATQRCLYFVSATSRIIQRNTNATYVQKVSQYFPVCLAGQTRMLCSAMSPLLHRSCVPTLSAVKVRTCVPLRTIQTEVDKQLYKFLEKEINYEETTAGKTRHQVKGVQGYDIKTEDAEVTLTRKSGNETVVIKFNVNSSVDSDSLPSDEESEPEMVAKPPFQVNIQKGDGRVLSLHCSYVSPDEVEHEGPQDTEAVVDQFEIHEVSLHSGDWKETIYSVQGDVMDGHLYDLLMDLLDERGINDEFVSQLYDFATTYEHSKYVQFLKNLKSFVEK